MPKTSTIEIKVSLDDQKVPEAIHWTSSDSGEEFPQEAKALLLSFWDSADKSALRIDLWTKKMMVDEMADFFYQTMVIMGDSYQRATQDAELAGDLKNFARDFLKKFREKQQQKK